MLSKIVSSRTGAIVVLLVTVVLSALAIAFSPDQPAVEATDGLPSNAQSTRVVELSSRFASGQSSSIVVVYERPDQAMTDADRAAVATVTNLAIAAAPGSALVQTVPSSDGRAVLSVVRFAADLSSEAESEQVDQVRAALAGDDGSRGATVLPAGITVYVTGGAAFQRDIAAAFDGANVKLLATTAIVVAILLLLTYRSPLLWLIPLLVIGLGDQVVTTLMPWLARFIGQSTGASVSGIVSVLVFGAGTDYALLLISRYREELRKTPDRREALAAAVTGAAPAIIASATTVILALCSLLAATLVGNRTLGIASALGILVALVFGIVVLPAALACLPRSIFWPFVPVTASADEQRHPTRSGLWWTIAVGVARRPIALISGATVILIAMCSTLPGLSVGLSQTEIFRTQVESVTGQEALARHYDPGVSQPVTVIANESVQVQVQQAIATVPGAALTGRAETSLDGELVLVSISLESESGTSAADQTIERLRTSLAEIDGADALVGGAPARDLDQRQAYSRDNWVTVPLILMVVFLVLVVLLRSLLAPFLLLVTVVGSFAASIGAGAAMLRTVLDVPALDSGVPLLSFLFLVALGVDYNIFLATRAQEEAAATGSARVGMTRALASTGGVITSAGVLLASVFAVLGVLPVIALTQIGVIVGLGVLLDTLVVRTIVVPAFAHLLGERFWWPARKRV